MKLRSNNKRRYKSKNKKNNRSRTFKSKSLRKQRGGRRTKSNRKMNRKIHKKNNKQLTNKSRRFSKAKRNYKQKGGKACSLGYAMVKGMEIPAINNVPGDIKFEDTYARLNINSDSCAPVASGYVPHPTVKTF